MRLEGRLTAASSSPSTVAIGCFLICSKIWRSRAGTTAARTISSRSGAPEKRESSQRTKAPAEWPGQLVADGETLRDKRERRFHASDFRRTPQADGTARLHRRPARRDRRRRQGAAGPARRLSRAGDSSLRATCAGPRSRRCGVRKAKCCLPSRPTAKATPPCSCGSTARQGHSKKGSGSIKADTRDARV
jgi:hypothetical protein